MALTACLAFGAFTAGPATAKFMSTRETTVSHIVQTTNHVITANPGTVTCKRHTAREHTVRTLVAGFVFTSKTTKYHTTASECTAFGFPAEVKTTGCDIEVLEPTELKASTKIVCEAGKQIEIVAIGFCTMTIGSQSPSGTVSFTNEGSGETRTIKAVNSITGISYGGNCGSGTNGQYAGTSVIKGYSSESLSTQVGVWVEP